MIKCVLGTKGKSTNPSSPCRTPYFTQATVQNPVTPVSHHFIHKYPLSSIWMASKIKCVCCLVREIWLQRQWERRWQSGITVQPRWSHLCIMSFNLSSIMSEHDWSVVFFPHAWQLTVIGGVTEHTTCLPMTWMTAMWHLNVVRDRPLPA